ncbi:MAG TPA: hypothetical protein VGO46_01455 [Gemmatimonadaceae bacterium]|jgi:hypothetical protein|nr:hypothetical protein [Gemmatimonadaceae bacterium]
MTRANSLWSALVVASLVAVPLTARAQYPTTDTTKSDTTKKPDAPPPPPAVKPATPGLDFSAWVFGDFQMQTDDAAKAANGGSKPNKFDIGRAYLTFKGGLGDRVSYRVTTDIKQGAGTDSYKGWFVRLKYAYLQYDYLKANADGASAFARLGVLHTVVVDHEENFWPRFMAQTALEKNGFFSSADLGISTGITLPNKLGEIYADVVNGTGYDNPENNKYKDFQARVTITPLMTSTSILKTLTISPWFSYGGNASVFLNSPTDAITDRLDKNRYGIFVGNKDRRLTFAGEYAERKDGADNNTTDVTLDQIVTTTGQLYDAFVIVRPLEFSQPNIKQSFGVIARYDHWKPNKDVDGYVQFLVGGVFWEPTRKVTLALDYQEQSPKSGISGAKAQSIFLHWNLVF